MAQIETERVQEREQFIRARQDAEDRDMQQRIAAIPDAAKRQQATQLYQTYKAQQEVKAQQDAVAQAYGQLTEAARQLRVREFADKYGADPDQLEQLSRTYQQTDDLERLAQTLGGGSGGTRREPAAARARVDSGGGAGTPAASRAKIVSDIAAQVKSGELSEGRALFEMHRQLDSAGFEIYPAQAG